MLYRANRLSRAHNMFRVAAYAGLNAVPEELKYKAGEIWRRFRLPYRLLEKGDTAIQIGAPWDTLLAGRSRSIHFGRIVGPGGRVIAIEPEDDSIDALTEFVARHEMTQLTLIKSGVWDAKAKLSFLANPNHPASNLVEEVIKTGRTRERFETIEIDVDCLDNLVTGLDLQKVKLLSVTTNGSELRILKGAVTTLSKVQYVSIITPAVSDFLSTFGFQSFGQDDRGYLFHNPSRG